MMVSRFLKSNTTPLFFDMKPRGYSELAKAVWLEQKSQDYIFISAFPAE